LVRQAVEFAAGVPLELTITDLDSHHGGTVRLVEAEVAKARNIRNALQRILDLPGARDDLIATLDARTDEDGVFYVRVDKQEAAQGRLVLTRGEDAIQVRLKMEHYPATREAAVALLGQMLASPQL
jgi:RNA-binding protein